MREKGEGIPYDDFSLSSALCVLLFSPPSPSFLCVLGVLCG
jgi:hypothetical protein